MAINGKESVVKSFNVLANVPGAPTSSVKAVCSKEPLSSMFQSKENACLGRIHIAFFVEKPQVAKNGSFREIVWSMGR
jgi:hypothetical protein